MAKLPKIYRKDINKNFSNNREYIYASKSDNSSYDFKKKDNVMEMINSLFNETGFIFNKPILIRTKDKVYDTAIIKKDLTSIYTLTEDVIKIEDILSIERK